LTEWHDRGMGRQRLPDGLFDLVVDAFEPVLPEEVYLVVKGRQVNARSTLTTPLDGVRFGGRIPWAFSSPASKGKIFIENLCEKIAESIGPVSAGPGQDAAAWPAPDASLRADVEDGQVTISFFGPDRAPLLTVGPVPWAGPWVTTEEKRSTDEASRRYVGPVPADHRELDELRDNRRAARDTATTELVDALMARNLGTDKTAITVALREELGHRPELRLRSDTRSEARVVELIAAVNGPHPRADGLITLARYAKNVIHVLRADRPGSG
jgi:hypothetical protein